MLLTKAQKVFNAKIVIFMYNGNCLLINANFTPEMSYCENW